MVIDAHVHPGFLKEISCDTQRIAFRRRYFGLYKQSIWPVALFIKQLDAAGIDKAIILPEDLTTRYGDTIVSNREILELKKLFPDRIIAFASIDPNRKDALEVLENVFINENFEGLKLNPSSQCFYPNDSSIYPIYEKCIKYNKPIIFHSGMSWEPQAATKYSHPLLFEDIALEYPDLRFCLSHFGWPWVNEVAMLMIKHKNIYADTALLYFDSPKEFFNHIFGSQLGKYWIDRSLNDKVLFGSNYPRIEQERMRQAVQSIEMRKSTYEKIMGENATSFLGGE